ncbi:hypothetical protein [Streptomyces aidingensis]|uniref:DUF2637 domain-containing protein n=1 Tax=Streptomyces aidingensis TaxID=910347 RepID=A0A1I1PVI7_9ACTN|nr:hypothetical protein [Streptomyces aidingensis]SFD13931.1 hypothetical protein SAMN05421773_11084 [Streptomyces aidingensis]
MTTITAANGTAPAPASEHPAPGTEPSEAELASYTLAAARAEAIRREAEAAAEAQRIRAEGEAEAARIKAAEEAERQRLANERAAMRLEKERADHEARMAEARARKAAAEAAAAEQRQAAEKQAAAEAAAAQKTEKAATRWRRTAMGFYALCAAVALPVQMAAFYDPYRMYLLLAPVLIEVSALVVLIGAAAAVTDRRPHWHYRLIAWGCAFVAAGINFTHGLEAFDTATAVGTAIASIAGPGIWDLHEHGRIRARDGKLSWTQRRAARTAAKAEAKRRAEESARAEAEKQAAEEAARARATELAAQRQESYPEEWKRALELAAALGETDVTDTVWARAWDDLHALPPGQTVDSIRGRNQAARRVIAAKSEAPGETPRKITSGQVATQMPTPRTRARTGPKPTPPVRRRGDTPRYSTGARRAASITAKQATQKEDK